MDQWYTRRSGPIPGEINRIRDLRRDVEIRFVTEVLHLFLICKEMIGGIMGATKDGSKIVSSDV